MRPRRICYGSLMTRGLILTILGCFLPLMVSAQITITDIVYDPPGADTGREWVGITNTGTSSVRVSDFKVRTRSGVNHKITPLSGVDTIAPGERAAIVQDATLFSADNASFSGTLFRASFTLTNKGGTVEIADKTGAIVATKSYQVPPPAPRPTAQKSARPKAAAQTIEEISTALPADENEETRERKLHEKPQSAAFTASAVSASSTVLWLAAVVAIAGFAFLAVFAARRVAKGEWEIVEEKEGD
ncbi:lamin tail domain-containing protein [Candidatus Kaiserbacteria bacterium]|nr:lamin tail domain-containing protein [Candidatus Kaiserbacteria bacterium]